MNTVTIVGKRDTHDYNLGGIYRGVNEDFYILARVDHDKYCAICLKGGNRFRDPSSSREKAVEGLEFISCELNIKLSLKH